MIFTNMLGNSRSDLGIRYLSLRSTNMVSYRREDLRIRSLMSTNMVISCHKMSVFLFFGIQGILRILM